MNKRLSRRSRGERTKRRERYLFSNKTNNFHNCDFDNGLLDDSLSSSTDSGNCSIENNFTARNSKSCNNMGPKILSNANQTVNRPKDHLYKILVIGDLGTGKTSIIKRYVHRFFTQHYRATIGVDFALKALTWDDNTLIRLQLWDIAGQERYGNMTRVYYKEAVGAFIVFDVTRRNTFESVINWKKDLDAKVELPDGSPIPCVLLANKCDQQKDYIVSDPSKMDEYCEKNKFTAWYETSARDNINIDEAANTLVKKILSYDCLRNNDGKNQDDHITLTADLTTKKSCAC